MSIFSLNHRWRQLLVLTLTMSALQAQEPTQVHMWRFKAVQNGNQALLVGVAESSGRRGGAGLYVSCIGLPDNPRTTAILRVHTEMLPFDPGSIEGPTQVGDDLGRVQIPGEPEFHVDIGSEGSDGKFSALSFAIDELDFHRMLESDGPDLTLSVKPSGKAPLTARFQLPPNEGAVQQMMSPCFQAIEGQNLKRESQEVLVCPTLPGKVLDDAKLMSAGKELEGEADDSGTAWDLTEARKQASAKSKLILHCMYRQAGYHYGSKVGLEVRELPVPPSASSCSVARETTETHSSAGCTRASLASGP